MLHNLEQSLPRNEKTSNQRGEAKKPTLPVLLEILSVVGGRGKGRGEGGSATAASQTVSVQSGNEPERHRSISISSPQLDALRLMN